MQYYNFIKKNAEKQFDTFSSLKCTLLLAPMLSPSYTLASCSGLILVQTDHRDNANGKVRAVSALKHDSKLCCTRQSRLVKARLYRNRNKRSRSSLNCSPRPLAIAWGRLKCHELSSRALPPAWNFKLVRYLKCHFGMVADATHSCPVPGHPEEGSLVQGVAQYFEDSNKLSLVPGKAQRKEQRILFAEIENFQTIL